MDKNLFSGLEDLGIDNIEDIGLFKKAEEKPEEINQVEIEIAQLERQKTHVYDKDVTCPVCNKNFKSKMVKSASPRIQKKDGDFFIFYEIINPYFYDVWLCNSCGYASMKADFLKIKDAQKTLITSKITSKWQGKSYPDIFDVNIAIERYKLALYNSVIMDSISSRKAMNCLKLAWMYRITEDDKNEKIFLTEALEGFSDCFVKESPPIYGMDQGMLMYLIGELYRRLADYDNANLWFSKLITTPSADQKIKEMARSQRDLIKESEALIRKNMEASETAAASEKKPTEKKGFFSKFFK